MRLVGTEARGIRLPIISASDDLANIVVDSIISATNSSFELRDGDVVGITEAIVAKAQGNYATIDDIASDVRSKFPDGIVGLVFPIMSRNRFLNVLKGIAKGADKVYVLLQCPADEVGNPLMDIELMDEVEEALQNGPLTAAEFKKITGNFTHPFTNMDYISLYESVSENIEVYVSKDPRHILKLTPYVLDAEIHVRNRTKARLLKAGAKVCYTLSDILNAPINGSGYNVNYGVLGSNIATGEKLKLFPRDCQGLVQDVQTKLLNKTGKKIEVLVYGDGAFKDPTCGIWELADPVVSPAYTEKLGGQPNEIKLKFVADNLFAHLDGQEKQEAILKMIKEKQEGTTNSEGTTPRKYADLLGSLCDLMSGSGDKGTPVIVIQGYFDDYSTGL